MILPDYMHRHWNVIEPSLLAISGSAGGVVALLLVPEASTPAEYGGLFVGFLIFLGMAVLGIAGFTATYIVQAIIKSISDIGGANAQKVLKLNTQEQFDAKFAAADEASAEQANEILQTLRTVQGAMGEFKMSVGLLNQKLDQQVARGDELREAIKKDVEDLQDAVYRRKTDS